MNTISKIMDISEVCKITGLPPSTLRFYEEKQLIRSCGRVGLRRRFHPSVVEQLNFISLAIGAGFSLNEIALLFTAQGQRINREMLVSKANALDKKIKEFAAMSKGLRHAAMCAAPNHFECPKFLRLLQVASRSRSRHRSKLKR